jgi:GrpB-like predicted nucleotidyltransferase (UPF0157 family)
MPSTITRDDEGRSSAAEDRIELVAPDHSWSRQFDLEAAALRSVLGSRQDIRFEHFGSTAVPDLRAKPIIDILLIHSNPEDWPHFIKPLEGLGYVFWAENPRHDQMFFVKGMPPFGCRRTHHVHVRTPKDADRELLFRDLLRTDLAVAREYERLKQDLAQRYATDRDAYTFGKTEFVARALGRYAV